METLFLVCVGALVGSRAHRRFKRPLRKQLLNWGYYLNSLKRYCELGTGTPFVPCTQSS